MAQPVYSTLFFSAHAAGGYSYPVPAGYRAVIRCICSFNGSAIINEISEMTIGSTGATFYQRDLGQQVCDITELHVVVDEGDTIVWGGGIDVDITVSGYLLSLP